MEHPRTTSARDHDDRDLIEGMEDAPAASGTSGGRLARDIASADEEEGVGDPGSHHRVTKQDAIDNDTARRTNRAR